MGTRIRNITEHESSIRASERQRISRDIHNGTSQLLVVLQLKIGQLRRQRHQAAEPIIAEMTQILREIRASIKQIETWQESEGHDCGDAREAIAKAFYGLKALPER